MCPCWSGRTGMTGSSWNSLQSGSMSPRRRCCGCSRSRSPGRGRKVSSPPQCSKAINRKRNFETAERRMQGCVRCFFARISRIKSRCSQQPCQHRLMRKRASDEQRERGRRSLSSVLMFIHTNTYRRKAQCNTYFKRVSEVYTHTHTHTHTLL